MLAAAWLITAYFGVDVLKSGIRTLRCRAPTKSRLIRRCLASPRQSPRCRPRRSLHAGVAADRRDANDALKMGPAAAMPPAAMAASQPAGGVGSRACADVADRRRSVDAQSTSLRGVDPGFDANHTWTGTLQIPDAKYATPEVRNQFFDRVIEHVRVLPGVQSAAWIDNIPFSGGSTQYVVVEGQPAMKDSERPVVAVRLPSPGYFATAKIAFISGRDFTGADGFGSPRVVIVSEKTAERFFPGQDPIGRHITLKMMTRSRRDRWRGARSEAGLLDSSEADSRRRSTRRRRNSASTARRWCVDRGRARCLRDRSSTVRRSIPSSRCSTSRPW